MKRITIGKERAIELLKQGYSMRWSRWMAKATINVTDSLHATIRYESVLKLLREYKNKLAITSNAEDDIYKWRG